MAKIQEYALSKAKLTSDEWGAVMHTHKGALILRDAAAFHALQAKKPEVQKQVETVQTVKPGVAAQQKTPAAKFVRDRQRLAKSGNLDDAAAALKHLLG